MEWTKSNLAKLKSLKNYYKLYG